MKAFRRSALVILSLTVLSACAGLPRASKTETLVLTAADNGKVHEVQLGQSFEVKLLGTPTAGYVWQVQSLPTGVVLVSSTSQPENQKRRARGMVGGSDWTLFRFTTLKAPIDLQTASSKTLVLRYGRPWEMEEGKPPENIWRADISVKPGR